MKRNILRVHLINKIQGERRQYTSLISPTSPASKDWTLELVDKGVECLSPRGELYFIPFSNVASVVFEKAEQVKVKPTKVKPTKVKPVK